MLPNNGLCGPVGLTTNIVSDRLTAIRDPRNAFPGSSVLRPDLARLLPRRLLDTESTVSVLDSSRETPIWGESTFGSMYLHVREGWAVPLTHAFIPLSDLSLIAIESKLQSPPSTRRYVALSSVLI